MIPLLASHSWAELDAHAQRTSSVSLVRTCKSMEAESENHVRVRVPCRAHQMATAENESTHLCLSLLCPRVTERANKRPEAMDDLILSVGVFRTRPTATVCICTIHRAPIHHRYLSHFVGQRRMKGRQARARAAGATRHERASTSRRAISAPSPPHSLTHSLGRIGDEYTECGESRSLALGRKTMRSPVRNL